MSRFQVILYAFFLAHAAIAAPQFLTVSDIHYGSQNISGDGKDTGDQLLALTVSKIKKLNKKVDFILVLGDFPMHLFGYAPEKEEYEKVVFHALFKADTTRKPMFYIAGNNDSLSGNYQPFGMKGKSPLDMAMDWDGACLYCNGLIIDRSHMRTEGYYSTYVMPNNKDIILIVLNTTQWMSASLLLPRYPNQDADALVQFQWFENQLKQHHAKQLLIAMHIPPGADYNGSQFWQENYLKQFVQLLKNNAHLYGQISLLTSHTHRDEFRKIQLNLKENIYAYSTPAISRYYHNNPAIKIFNLNSKMQMNDFTTYYTTSTYTWGLEHYNALNAPEAIFPNCQQKNLSECLDNLSDEQVCNYIEKGLFYGVKSLLVDNKACRKIYKVNNL